MIDEQQSRPALRDSVLVFARGAELQFCATTEQRVISFTAEPFVHALLPLLDGTRTRRDLLAAVADQPGASATAINEVLDSLAGERLLARHPAWDSKPELQRYDRQFRLFAELAASIPCLPADPVLWQRRLQRSTVGVLGAGGSGSWVLLALAASGIGVLRIADPDVVSRSNLNRQVLYGAASVGATKVSQAEQRLRDLNPDTTIETCALTTDGPDSVAAFVSDCDVVVNCADKPSVTTTSDWVSAACLPMGIPHIVGGAYAGHLGVLGMSVVPLQTTCWSCARTATANDHDRASMHPVKGGPDAGGSLAAIAGTIGNLLAWEVLRILLGLPLALADGVREIDLMSLEWRVRSVPPAPSCPYCNTRSRNGTSAAL